MHFEYPWILLAGLLFLFCQKRCPLRMAPLLFPHINRVARVSKTRVWLRALSWMAWSGLIVALASPVSETPLKPLPMQEGACIVVTDFVTAGATPSASRRSDGWREALANALKRCRRHRLGIVGLNRYAFLVAPVTSDRRALLAIFEGMPPARGWEREAIFDAVAMGVARLGQINASTKTIVVAVRGDFAEGIVPADVVRRMLKSEGIRLFVVAIGRKQERFRQALSTMADATGGVYVETTDVASFKRTLATLEQRVRNVDDVEAVRTRYYYSYPLFVAAMSLLGWLFLWHRPEVK